MVKLHYTSTDDDIVEDSLEITARKSVNQLQYDTESVKANIKESQTRLTDYKHQIRSLSASIRYPRSFTLMSCDNDKLYYLL